MNPSTELKKEQAIKLAEVSLPLDYAVDRAGNFEVPKAQVLAALQLAIRQTNEAMKANKK